MSWEYSSTQEAKLMKIKYGKLIDKQFNEENVLFGRIKKMEDFEGKQIEFPVINSIGGGVSSGSLGSASVNKNSTVTLTTKKMYAVVSIDRETMKASKSDEGSFVRFTKHPVQVATRSFNRNLERMITRGDATGSGALAGGDNSTNVTGAGSSGSPFVVVLASDANMASFEEGDILNYDAETTELLVAAVDESAKSLSLVGTSSGLAALAGSGPVPTAKYFYIQKSKDNEITGIKGVLEATSGSLFGVAVGRRWQAYKKDASAALSTDLINDVIINVKKKCGKSPKLALASYKQYLAALNLQEDHKRYNIPARKASFSFEGLEILTPEGPIAMVASRFVEDKQVYFLNDDHIELHLRPGGFEWFSEDGSVFMRESSDSYEARYGGYGQLFVNPHFQGLLDNLS
jgi:hypothetical protein